jgi:hypothetical protein
MCKETVCGIRRCVIVYVALGRTDKVLQRYPALVAIGLEQSWLQYLIQKFPAGD